MYLWNSSLLTWSHRRDNHIPHRKDEEALMMIAQIWKSRVTACDHVVRTTNDDFSYTSFQNFCAALSKLEGLCSNSSPDRNRNCIVPRPPIFKYFLKVRWLNLSRFRSHFALPVSKSFNLGRPAKHFQYALPPTDRLRNFEAHV